MSQFLPVNADEGNDFYIEVMPASGQIGITQRSREVSEKLTNTEFKQMIRQAVMPACKTFVEVWQELNQPLTADSAEVEFSLGFTASGSAVIVQASGQASFKVKVNWKFADSKQPTQKSQLMSTNNFLSPMSLSSTDKNEFDSDPLNNLEEYLNWLSTQEAKNHLSQVNAEVLQALAALFRILPTTKTEAENNKPPENLEDLIEWLPTETGRKYIKTIDKISLGALLVMAGPSIKGP